MLELQVNFNITLGLISEGESSILRLEKAGSYINEEIGELLANKHILYYFLEGLFQRCQELSD